VTAPALPGDDDVRAAADELLTQHRAGGTYPSVSALAKGFGINRTTFYRHYAARSPPRCLTAPHTNTPKARNNDGRAAKMTTATKPFGASAAKTTTYDAISKSTKYTFACSPSKTQHTEPNSNDWLASPT
jgi:hypothetical protein